MSGFRGNRVVVCCICLLHRRALVLTSTQEDFVVVVLTSSQEDFPYLRVVVPKDLWRLIFCKIPHLQSSSFQFEEEVNYSSLVQTGGHNLLILGQGSVVEKVVINTKDLTLRSWEDRI